MFFFNELKEIALLSGWPILFVGWLLNPFLMSRRLRREVGAGDFAQLFLYSTVFQAGGVLLSVFLLARFPGVAAAWVKWVSGVPGLVLLQPFGVMVQAFVSSVFYFLFFFRARRMPWLESDVSLERDLEAYPRRAFASRARRSRVESELAS